MAGPPALSHHLVELSGVVLLVAAALLGDPLPAVILLEAILLGVLLLMVDLPMADLSRVY